MERYLLTPIPNLNRTPQPASEEERLKLILRNIETRRYQVHVNVLQSAQAKVAASKHDINDDHKLTSNNANRNVDPEELPDAPDPDTFPEGADEAFFASLSAPYVDSLGDLSFAKGNAPSPSGQVDQASTSPQYNSAGLAAVLEALERLEDYDKTFRETRDIYSKALEKEKSRNRADNNSRTSAPTQPMQQARRASVSHAHATSPSTPSGPDRRVSMGPAESGVGMYDAARDPRNRR